MDKLEGDLFKS